MTLFSYIAWAVLGVLGLALELVGVTEEKKLGVLPLTRIVRDRLMRKHVLLKLAFLLFWAWLGLHWLVPLHW